MAVEEIRTEAAVMSLARKLEEEGAEFYSALSQQYPAQSATFAALAKENKRFISQVETTYYSVISDALEGCFSFRLDPAAYRLNLTPKPGAGLSAALKTALAMEEKIIQFYSQSADHSKGLLADVPRVMAQVAQKREKRRATLQEMEAA
jgi:rubrerythrin